MSYYDSYTFRKEVMGKRIRVPDDFVMYGVVDEPYDGAKWILCEVKFTDYPPEDDVIGSCFVTHLLEDEKKDTNDPKLMLEISIWDQNGESRQKSYSALRDAAISGNRFCHFRIETEAVEHSDVLTQLGGEGETLAHQDRFVDTGDMLELRGDRYYFVGRRGGIINVGGRKVHPSSSTPFQTRIA
jgi:acyl-CoA synthetase (AMP-forming)/AMP-acid ligase II